MAESLIYDLCKAVGSKVLEEGRLLHGVLEEAKKMEKKLQRIKAVMIAAEQREVIDEDVKEWIRELKDVAYDIEDVLDDWSIAQLQAQDLELSTSPIGNWLKAVEVCFSCIPAPSFCFKQAKSRRDIAHAIVKINERLDDINEMKNNFSFPILSINTSSSINEGRPRREDTTSFKKFITVDSQDQHKVQLIEKLVHGDFKSTTTGDIPILSVVGLGGIGKTTLARMVYNNETVQSHFNKTIWVCVSNTFVEVKVAKDIAKGLGLEVGDDSRTQDVLSKVGGYLRGSTCKFLLVLDDVWEQSAGKWGDILGCIEKGDTKGSRILMTTRSSVFAKKMGAAVTTNVEELSEDDSWKLFSYYAFHGDPDHRGIVEGIAKELAKRCDGLPLALEVLGRHMVTKTEISEWDKVLNSKMWGKDFQDNVFCSLSLSYLELQSEVKRCFAFCSIFPKDTILSKSDLIRQWMAQGYLQERKDCQMEDYGEDYFISLVSRSFFQVTSPPFIEDQRDTYVTMHDIVHDFAQFISNGEALILDTSSLQLTECARNSIKLRHLLFSEEINEANYPHSCFNPKALRSLLLSTPSETVLKKLWSYKPYIRALHIELLCDDRPLNVSRIKDIGKLVHLRYVCLISTFLTMLPEEICSLPYLQTLDLEACHQLESLPKEIGRLTCLRHILFSDGPIVSLLSLPKGLGKLSSLHTLSYFLCSSVDSKDCSSLEDLGDLNNLRGRLWLKNLNQVAQVSEATKAQLHMKKHIRHLKIEFGEGDPSLQSDVLEALEPAKETYIELLEIYGHRGQRCPRWIGGLRNLKEVVLEYVGMEVLPAGLGMLCFLEKLFIKRAERVKHVGVEFFGISEPDTGFFPKLTNLEFYDMPQWEQWESPKEIGSTIMPCLRHLKATECEALRTLPRFLEQVHLESLIVDSLHLPQVIELVDDDDCLGKFQWRMGDFLLPQTLKEIRTASTELVQEEAPGRHAETTLEVVQQQQHDINFTFLHIISKARVPGWIMDLTYLKHIELDDIEDECLPPLGLMPSLEELEIRGEKVEKVGDEFLGLFNSNYNDGDHIAGGAASKYFKAFPRLKKLTFLFMSAWEEWEDPAYRNNNNNNIVIMPYLARLEIVGCRRLKCLPQFFERVPLNELSVKGTKYKIDMLKIRNTTEDESTCKMVKGGSSTILAQQPDFLEIELGGVRNEWLCDWAKYCGRLKLLKLERCNEASLVGLEVLTSLEKLHLGEFDDLRRMPKEVLRISSLKELYLNNLRCLEEWEDPPLIHLEDESRESQHDISNSSIMSNLRILRLHKCKRLKALPSFLKSKRLEILAIRNCKALETWWANEAVRDWRHWRYTISKFTFLDKHSYPVMVPF